MREQPALRNSYESVQRCCAHTKVTQKHDPECVCRGAVVKGGAKGIQRSRFTLPHRGLRKTNAHVIDLSSVEAIHYHAISGFIANHHTSLKKKKRSHQQQQHHHVTFHLSPNKLRLPTEDQLSDSEDPFGTPKTHDEDEGFLIPVKRQKYGNTILNNNENNDVQVDAFADYINWATTDNPDGVAIVHDAIDQGKCGSCWALAATGSLEANAARREAAAAFTAYRATQSVINATLLAQAVERQALEQLNLSIQELIDCDTDMDLGCTGGNPLLAFDFIHRYGLASAEKYPYSGIESTCHKKSAHTPIATVQSWGILPPNSERHMELALRYIGPIAVGFNGAAPAFLSYAGGIFSHADCGHDSNHALLVVGYGEEEIADDMDGNVTVQPFWIARNSIVVDAKWGTGWGENGFVRIQREKGGHGQSGQCGIARSPSVALGGVLLDRIVLSSISTSSSSSEDPFNDDTRTPIVLEPVAPYTFLEEWCVRTGQSIEAGTCAQWAQWSATHKALWLGILGLAGTLLGVVWPLTSECRRRASRRRQRQLSRAALVAATEEQNPLIQNGKSMMYGSDSDNHHVTTGENQTDHSASVAP